MPDESFSDFIANLPAVPVPSPPLNVIDLNATFGAMSAEEFNQVGDSFDDWQGFFRVLQVQEDGSLTTRYEPGSIADLGGVATVHLSLDSTTKTPLHSTEAIAAALEALARHVRAGGLLPLVMEKDDTTQ